MVVVTAVKMQRETKARKKRTEDIQKYIYKLRRKFDRKTILQTTRRKGEYKCGNKVGIGGRYFITGSPGTRYTKQIVYMRCKVIQQLRVRGMCVCAQVMEGRIKMKVALLLLEGKK